MRWLWVLRTEELMSEPGFLGSCFENKTPGLLTRELAEIRPRYPRPEDWKRSTPRLTKSWKRTFFHCPIMTSGCGSDPIENVYGVDEQIDTWNKCSFCHRILRNHSGSFFEVSVSYSSKDLGVNYLFQFVLLPFFAWIWGILHNLFQKFHQQILT